MTTPSLSQPDWRIWNHQDTSERGTMSDRWPPPGRLLAYLLIRLAVLGLFIVMISTGLLVQVVLVFMPFIVLWLGLAVVYRRTMRWTRGWWH
jgi:hypothetical protein